MAVSLALLLSAFLLPGSAYAATCGRGQYSGAWVRRGLYQLTGTQNQPRHRLALDELADPAPPYITDSGGVEIYGTAQYFIRYASWSDFEHGGCYNVVPLALHGPRGKNYIDDTWDIRKFRVITSGQPDSELIIGGTTSTTGQETEPTSPADDSTRRIFFYRPDQVLGWVRDHTPIVGQVSPSWMGHSYGGNLLQEGSPLNTVIESAANAIAFFYERVDDDQGNTPYKTELFAQSMDSEKIGLLSSQIPIFQIGAHPYPSLRRVSGGFLAEGPRAIQVTISGQTFFIIGFSSGDFPTDNYHINYLWSRSLFGPYQPKLTADKTDLLDLGADLKRSLNLSWVGRPAFFQAPDGSFEMLFHAVEKRLVPDNDYSLWPADLGDFFRNVYKADVVLSLDSLGEPDISFR